MSAPTPAPWWITRRKNKVGQRLQPSITAGVYQIAVMSCVSSSEGEANARLIAAAPELLDVLRRVVAECAPDRGEKLRADRVWNELLAEAEAVVAKAEGR